MHLGFGVTQDRCFVISMGLDMDLLFKRLMSISPPITFGDHVLIVAGTPSRKQRKIRRTLQEQLSIYGYDGPIRHIIVEPDNPAKSMQELTKHLRDCRGRTVYFEAGSRLCLLDIEVLILLILLGFETHINIKQEDGAMVSIPWGVIVFLKELGSRKSEARLIDAMAANPGADIGTLARILGVSEKTVRNKISHLRKLGLVERRRRGVPRLSEWGNALAEIIRNVTTGSQD